MSVHQDVKSDIPLLHPAVLPIGYVLLICGRANAERKDPRYKLRVPFFLSVALLCLFQILYRVCAPHYGNGLGGAITGLIFSASDLILLKNYYTAPMRIRQKEPTWTMSRWDRIKFSTSLVFSPRQIGFTTQCTPPHIRTTSPSVTRAQFLVSGAAWMVFYCILYDVCCLIGHAVPMFGVAGPSFSDYPWYWRAAVWVQIIAMSAIMSMIYTTMSLIGVGFGINSPQSWPPFFGSFKDAYTVRNSWGRVWHQMLRKMVSHHGKAAADILHLPKGTLRTYFEMYIAFLISGLLHLGGDYMYLKNMSGTSVQFFLLQAVAITFEDIVMGIARRVGFTSSTRFTRAVGFCWVFAWFAVSVPYWLEPVWHVGLFNVTSADRSLLQYLLTGQSKVLKGVY